MLFSPPASDENDFDRYESISLPGVVTVLGNESRFGYDDGDTRYIPLRRDPDDHEAARVWNNTRLIEVDSRR